MRTEKKFRTKPRKRTARRILNWILALAGVLILSLFFLLPAFVSSEKGRKTILAKINNSVGGETDFSTLSMSWWKGIKVTDVSFNDGLGRTSAEARQLTTIPHYGSILAGSLSFGKTIIDDPKIEVNLKPSRSGQAETSWQEAPTANKSQPIILPIKKIELVFNNGTFKVTDAQAETVELSQINSRLNLRPPGQQTDFNINMEVLDDSKESKIHAGGQITARRRTGWSLKGTSGDLTIEVNDLDLGSLGPLFALAGVEVQAKGSLSGGLEIELKDGRIEDLSGTIKGRALDVTSNQLKGDRLTTNYLTAAIELHREKALINIDKLEVEGDWLSVRAQGSVPTTFKSLTEFAKADSKSNFKGSFECDLAAALSQMPRTFGLKEDTKVSSGRLSGNVETTTENGKRQINGRASLSGLAGIVAGTTISISEPVMAEAEITSDKAGIKYDKLDFSAAFAKVRGSGTSELLRYDAEADLAKLQSELGKFLNIGPYKMGGEVFSKGEVSSQKGKLAAVGSSVVKNILITSAEGISASEPMAEIDFSVKAEPDKNILNVDFLKTRASFGRIDIENSIVPLNKQAAKPAALTISAHNIDLEKLQPFAVLFASFPKEIQLSGAAESQISVNSKAETYRIKTDSTNITNLKLLSAGQKPFIQEQVSFVFDGDYNASEKNWLIRKLQLISPDIKIDGDFQKDVERDKTTFQGRVDFEYDWAAVSAFAGPYLPEGLKLQGKRKDVINLFSQCAADQKDEFLANLSTKGKLGFERADYMGLVFGPTDVDVKIQNGLLEIAPFSSKVNNGQLNFAGLADFKRKPTLLKTERPIQIAKNIQINDRTTRQLLQYLNPVFANAVNVSGVVNFSCEQLAIPLAAAAKNDAIVVGTVEIDRLRLQASDLLGQVFSLIGTSAQGQDIKIHPTRFVLQDGFLRYEDMQMDVGDNPVNFKGVVGLDKSLNMKVTLPYTTHGRTARVGKDTVGKRITLPLKGTIDKPQLDVGKLLEEQLKQRLEDELQKGLEKIFK